MIVSVRVVVSAYGPIGFGSSEREIKGESWAEVLAEAQAQCDQLVPEAIRFAPAEVNTVNMEFVLSHDLPKFELRSFWREALSQLASIVAITPELTEVHIPERTVVTHPAQRAQASGRSSKR